jgi:hypothetical protein
LRASQRSRFTVLERNPGEMALLDMVVRSFFGPRNKLAINRMWMDYDLDIKNFKSAENFISLTRNLTAVACA